MKSRTLTLILCAILFLSGCGSSADLAAAGAQVQSAFDALLDAPAYHIRLEHLLDEKVTMRCDTWHSGGNWYQTGNEDIQEYLWLEGQCLIPTDAPVAPEEGVYILIMNGLQKLDPALKTVTKVEQNDGETVVTAASSDSITLIYVLSPDGGLRSIEKQVAMTDGSTLIDRITVESLDETAIAAAIAEKAAPFVD